MFGAFAFAAMYYADSVNATPTPPVGDTAFEDKIVLGQKESISVTTDPILGGWQAWGG